jgi:hypothetical protein
MTHDTDRRLDRRDLLKRSALLGGAVVWTTPVIQSIGGAAWAAQGSGCGCLTGGGGQLSATYEGVPGTVTFGVGKICCGSDKTTLQVNFHPTTPVVEVKKNGKIKAAADGDTPFHFTTILTLECTNTGDPAPPPSSTDGANHFEGTATNDDGDHISFTFEDNGEPGTSDQASLTITDASGGVLTASGFSGGNLQAHRGKC